MKIIRLPGPALILAVLLAAAQAARPVPPADIRAGDIFKAFAFRGIGPARQNGRVLHIAVDERRPSTFYIAPSTGGLWKTVNNGTTFASVLPGQDMVPMGHVALAPSNPDIVWVGTGDAASGRIPMRGFGVWKSTDAGTSWSFMGLAETRHIGRVAVDPRNPDVVYIAAVGYHFSNGPDRGLYKTMDGGRTWEKALFISDKVGVVDVALNPVNPDIVFAVSYDKQRVPWSFDEGGPETAIYRSRDGGKTWQRLAGGLPAGKLARCGVAIYPRNPDIVYAFIDNLNGRVPDEKPPAGTAAQGGAKPAPARPIGGEVYRSEDGGDTWTKMNRPQDSIGGGKWYGVIFLDPNDDKVVYVPGVSLCRSLDGGKTWGKNGPENIAGSFHVDYHGIWIDPRDSRHLILGSDGGLAVSWDFGATWDVFDHLPLAQFYAVGVDMEEPYNIYGGLQDNGSIKIPSNGPGGRITRDDWTSVGGGDGMVNVVDPEDSRWLYNEYQHGAIQRVDQRTGRGRFIRPRRAAGTPPYRFNWTTPLVLSPHNPRILYFGAQMLLRSLDRGDTWQEISPDLTSNDPVKLKGNIEFCTLTSISESPLAAGVLWTGSDDGKVQLSKNSGGSWTDRTPALAAVGAPAEFFVTRVFASPHAAGTAFVAKAGWHRDVYKPYVFRTDNFGETWTDIGAGLPEGTVYVVVQDRRNAALLFVGTEMGVFATLDGGKAWFPFGSGLPPHALVHDLLIHPRENDLVAATHGRGLWLCDISALQEMGDAFWTEDVHLFDVEPKIQWPRDRVMNKNTDGERQFSAPNEPAGLAIRYYLKAEVKDKPKIRITDALGREAAVLDGQIEAGLHEIVWNFQLAPASQVPLPAPLPEFRRAPRLAPPGEYIIILESGGQSWKKKALIRPAPNSL